MKDMHIFPFMGDQWVFIGHDRNQPVAPLGFGRPFPKIRMNIVDLTVVSGDKDSNGSGGGCLRKDVGKLLIRTVFDPFTGDPPAQSNQFK